jgi:hypothetical protein
VGDRERGRPAASAQAAHAQLVWVRGLAAPRIDLNNCAQAGPGARESGAESNVEASLSAGALACLPVPVERSCPPSWATRTPQGPNPKLPSQGRERHDTFVERRVQAGVNTKRCTRSLSLQTSADCNPQGGGVIRVIEVHISIRLAHRPPRSLRPKRIAQEVGGPRG